MLSVLCKNLAEILKYFSYFPQKIRIQFARNFEAYFLDKNKKNIINLSPVELARKVVKVNVG